MEVVDELGETVELDVSDSCRYKCKYETQASYG